RLDRLGRLLAIERVLSEVVHRGVEAGSGQLAPSADGVRGGLAGDEPGHDAAGDRQGGRELLGTIASRQGEQRLTQHLVVPLRRRRTDSGHRLYALTGSGVGAWPSRGRPWRR